MGSRHFLKLAPLILGCVSCSPVRAQATDQTTLRYYLNVGIPANQPRASASMQLPAGNAWRVVSITALASLGNVVTSDVDTFLASNPSFEVKATESGSIETYILPGAVLTATAQKKRQMGAASVVVIVTVRKP